jgi:hypothetical protein
MIEFDLPPETLEQLIELSVTGKASEMYELSIIEEQEKIKNIISSFIDTKHYHYGNLFSHINPFTIHADISDKKQTIMLMPISAAPSQHFIVFDQTINSPSPVSWIWNIFDDKTDKELEEMYYLSALKSRPCEYKNISGLTNKPIDDGLMQHLPYSKEFYYSLSGKAWPYTPGKALIFSAVHPHATGIMQSPKIGCTVQFNVSYEQVILGLNSSIQHNRF